MQPEHIHLVTATICLTVALYAARERWWALVAFDLAVVAGALWVYCGRQTRL